jgi:hypothetical protein
LFIYLTHFQFQSLARRIVDQPLFAVALALVGGVLVTYCWNTLTRHVIARLGGRRKARGEQAVERATSP